MINQYQHKMKLTELANKLFMYTDSRDWTRLQNEVFSKKVDFDMSSSGGAPRKTLLAEEICEAWKKGLSDIDQVHHQAGHYIIEIKGDKRAGIYAYAVATHYKKGGGNGHITRFTGSYNLEAELVGRQWKICGFTFNQKFLETGD